MLKLQARRTPSNQVEHARGLFYGSGAAGLEEIRTASKKNRKRAVAYDEETCKEREPDIVRTTSETNL